MTSRDFAYWLQGFFEINDPQTITKEQTQIIKNHLNLVFHHEIDKQYQDGDKSQEIHDGKPQVNFSKPPIPTFPNKFPWENQPNDGLIRC